MGTHKFRYKLLLVALIFLLLNDDSSVNAKRIYSGGGRRTSSSGHRTSGHTSHGSSHTSHGSSHTSHGSSHSSQPSYTHHVDAPRLTYGSNTHTQPRPSSTGFGSGSTSNHQAAPIGWNVPKQQGPPPAYSPTNPLGGAKTNVHEPPPPYRPAAVAPSSYKPVASAPPAPSYGTASQTNRGSTYPLTNTHHGTSGAGAYRPRANNTGYYGGSSGGYGQPPITATNVQNVHSSYPRQQVPSGGTYYPSASHLPPGATYHPTGSLPNGATYHPTGTLPHGTTYHTTGSLPNGATYYPSGIPAGANYHPAPSYSVPAGATFLSPGSALPPGAVYYAQPPKTSSSGLGFGSGLAAGALGGALLGHALTPTHTQTRYVDNTPYYGGGGSGGGGHSNDDRVIIINNGPPGSVSTTNAGAGTTVINTGGGAQPVPAPQPAGQPMYSQPPLAQTPPVAQQPAVAAEAPAPVQSPAPAPGVAPSGGAAAGAAPGATPPTPQPGGIICVPVQSNEPDPADSTKTVVVEKIACYPAPPATESSPAPAGATQQPTTLANGVPLASLGPTTPPPPGAVPLAPLSPSGETSYYKLPGQPLPQRSSEAMMAPNSPLHLTGAAAANNLAGFSLTTLLTFLIAYTMH